MKRLRKFNESASQIDYDYVYSCFGELIDDNKVKIVKRRWDLLGNYITIAASIPAIFVRVGDGKKNAMKIKNSELLDYIKKSNSELLKEVVVALTRLSEEYPGYKVNFEILDNGLSSYSAINQPESLSFHINIFTDEENFLARNL
jgi:hypothetical protein